MFGFIITPYYQQNFIMTVTPENKSDKQVIMVASDTKKLTIKAESSIRYQPGNCVAPTYSCINKATAQTPELSLLSKNFFSSQYDNLGLNKQTS